LEYSKNLLANIGLGRLRLESPTLVTSKGAEVLPKTPFEVDYV